MDQVFRTRDDWFGIRIKPAIIRRTIIGIILIAIGVYWWQSTQSLIPVVLTIAVILERIFEFVNIPSTKIIIASNTVACSDDGLLFRSNIIKGGVLYPWDSMKATFKNYTDGRVKFITVEDTSRKGSKIKLEGYVAMNDLKSIIEQRAKNTY